MSGLSPQGGIPGNGNPGGAPSNSGVPIPGAPQPGAGPPGFPPGFDPTKQPGAFDDLGPSTKATVWVLLAVSGLFLSLRIYCKLMQKRRTQLDDWVLIASWIAFLGNVVATTVAVGYGHGKHFYMVLPENIDPLAISGLISVTFAIVSQAWSKTSFALTLLRISEGWMRWFIWFAIISINILMGLGALFFWVNCTPLERAWKPLTPGTCWSADFTVIYGIIVSAWSGIMDLTLATIPWKIILSLQMRRTEKFGVALAMSMGVAAAVAAFIKCSHLPSLKSGDFAFDGAHLVIWGAAETAVTIMAASIPVMRVLVRDIASTARYYRSDKSGSSTSTSAGGSKVSSPSRFHGIGSSYPDHSTAKGPPVPPKSPRYNPAWSEKGLMQSPSSVQSPATVQSSRVLPQGRIMPTSERNWYGNDASWRV